MQGSKPLEQAENAGVCVALGPWVRGSSASSQLRVRARLESTPSVIIRLVVSFTVTSPKRPAVTLS